MIKPMERELTHMLTVHIIKVIGLMINSMVQEWSPGLMELNMKDNIKMVKKMGKES
jgi:hypothetical protein